MSSIPSRPLRPEIQTILQKLRLKIQTYLLFHGVALVLVTLCLGFFGTLILDWLHFSVRKVELSVLVRVALAMAMIGAIAWVLANQVVVRLLRSKNARALALLLERRFPQLNDRLITAVEMSGSLRSAHTPLSDAMVEETIASVAGSTREIELEQVFDWKPLVTSWVVAVVLLAGVGATALGAPQAFERWTRGFVYFDQVYWLRESRLEVVVLAAPGDRPRSFVDGVYLHPRGADLKLLVTVPESERPQGGTWVVPDNVEIEYEFSQGRGGDVKPLARRGERQFQFKMPAVLDGMTFWVSGNDYINRMPYRIEVVDPPQPSLIALDCDYPDYTRLDIESLDRRQLQGKQLSVPLETHFLLHVDANKPLRNLTLQAGELEFALGRFDEKSDADTATLRKRSESGEINSSESLPSDYFSRVFSADRKTMTLPFLLTTHDKTKLADRTHRLPEKLGEPWILPPESEIKLYLEDEDGIISAEPVKFTILGQVDQPPVVETELYGIGSSITRQASIPVKGLITDDYGVETALFEFKVDEEEKFRPRPFRNQPIQQPLEFRLARNEKEPYERFEVVPLDLTIGQKLTLTVLARDADNLNGPHETRGQTYTFKIVSREELLGLLYDRELNLRRQFEQIISEVERTRKDLLDHRALSEELDTLKASMETTAEQSQRIDEIEVALVNCAERSLHQIGKNRAETSAVRETFERILEELVNNNVHTRQMNERIEALILTPLTTVTQVDFPAADESVGLFRQANEQNADPKPRIDQSVARLDEMLLRMKQILSEMSDLAEFHEALKDLKNLIVEQEELLKETQEKQKDSVKNKLKGLELE